MDDNEFQQLEDKVTELTKEYEKLYKFIKKVSKDELLNYASELESIRNDIKNKNTSLDEELQETKNLLKKSQNTLKNINEKDRLTNEAYQNIQKNQDEIGNIIDTTVSEINDSHEKIEERFKNIKNTIAENEKQMTIIDSQLEESKAFLNAANTLSAKMKPLHQESVKLKNEISDLYDEIYGYEYEDQDGQKHTEDGLKRKLETTYDKLKSDATTLSGMIPQTINDANSKIQNYLEKQENKYQALYEKIERLLPSAFTAGLASAYEKKRISEEKSLKKANCGFLVMIILLAISSFIPIYIGNSLLEDQKTIYDIISYMPKIVSFILPVYIPLLWAAINFNKQAKLSKRLIEEYTHKEVINKTFEGLSRQAEQVDSDNAHELNIKLLYNIINMMSDNPGQLIKGFEQSDHPLVEVLNNIMKSEDLLDKISKHPNITSFLEKVKRIQDKTKSNNTKNIENSIKD